MFTVGIETQRGWRVWCAVEPLKTSIATNNDNDGGERTEFRRTGDICHHIQYMVGRLPAKGTHRTAYAGHRRRGNLTTMEQALLGPAMGMLEEAGSGLSLRAPVKRCGWSR